MLKTKKCEDDSKTSALSTLTDLIRDEDFFIPFYGAAMTCNICGEKISIKGLHKAGINVGAEDSKVCSHCMLTKHTCPECKCHLLQYFPLYDIWMCRACECVIDDELVVMLTNLD
jgi:hypothetical protein